MESGGSAQVPDVLLGSEEDEEEEDKEEEDEEDEEEEVFEGRRSF